MTPVFRNREISCADLRGDSWRNFPRTMVIWNITRDHWLVVCFKWKYHCLAICWSGTFGLVWSSWRFIDQYIPRELYKPFGESVSEAKHVSDNDLDHALLANVSKLVGKSVYGKTITDEEHHKNMIVMCQEEKRFHSESSMTASFHCRSLQMNSTRS